ncbi:molybdenum cofactor biosynthesis protein MoaE [Olivibacter sp. SDN3]|uniref:molybdenum cofactor biosynthesis protein MoaE n=1 Tax=Olivibacter sp. SDN3 TaxID=2764720 RepID=UPI0016510A6A|nr:molybdenum cofactor biosynthesis protein MoaE [Olivibacter sp. SDN3]QNL48041.1 molybdenum cofactor biosynthesis protein MoaE [Olivibacter sp. SDN3]
MKQIFQQGAIIPSFITDSLAKHAAKTSIGAHSIFLDQVRVEKTGAVETAAIEYKANEEVALEKMHAIREETFAKFKLTCMHVHHSLGVVYPGEITLFVFTSSAHRRDAIDACNELVERIKNELPISSKELTVASNS